MFEHIVATEDIKLKGCAVRLVEHLRYSPSLLVSDTNVIVLT